MALIAIDSNLFSYDYRSNDDSIETTEFRHTEAFYCASVKEPTWSPNLYWTCDGNLGTRPPL
jgi:hypothetical protein